MPSPAMSVMRCAHFHRGLARFPEQQRQGADDIHHHQPRRQHVQLVEADAACVGCRQPRREAADVAVDAVGVSEHDHARIEGNGKHRRDERSPHGESADAGRAAPSPPG